MSLVFNICTLGVVKTHSNEYCQTAIREGFRNPSHGIRALIGEGIPFLSANEIFCPSGGGRGGRDCTPCSLFLEKNFGGSKKKSKSVFWTRNATYAYIPERKQKNPLGGGLPH